MDFQQRIELIQDIERQRQSTVICYLTSIRPNLGASMSDDAVRVIFDHLLQLPERPVAKLDIFLCSDGGDGVLPWRLIPLFREFATRIGVLIPYHAYSAATLLALGADEIVLHPFAEMGPIDPTVANAFNPTNPLGQSIGIGVEDVKAYISFVKDTVGLQHQDALVRTLEILAHNIHPLALGNVERSISQTRMIARKLLLTHMDETESRRIDDLIETLTSKLYFHGHPINRREAQRELGLKIAEDPPPQLETAMWNLYVAFEHQLRNREIYDPTAEIYRTFNPTVGTSQIPLGSNITTTDTSAIIESTRLSSAFAVQRRYVVAGIDPNCEPIVREQILRQGWENHRTTTSD